MAISYSKLLPAVQQLTMTKQQSLLIVLTDAGLSCQILPALILSDLYLYESKISKVFF